MFCLATRTPKSFGTWIDCQTISIFEAKTTFLETSCIKIVIIFQTFKGFAMHTVFIESIIKEHQIGLTDEIINNPERFPLIANIQ